MRRPILTRTVSLVLACALGASIALIASPAGAVTNSRIRAKQAEAVEAGSVLEDLNDQLELKVEEYDAATEQLDLTTVELQRAEQLLVETEHKLDGAQTVLETRVDTIYRTGGMDVLDVIVGVTSFEDLASRVELLNTITTSDAELVGEVKVARQQVSDTERALENRRAEQVALRRQIDVKRAELEAAALKQRQYLDSLNAEVKQLVDKERERQRRLAEARARAALRYAGGYPRRTDGPLGPSHPEAAEMALRFIGVPYVWGGTSPTGGFDCSGLCYYVYRQLGISLPRTSRSMYKVGQFIAASKLSVLEPGDLVFFGYGGSPYRVHHVGMYVGRGDFVHAPGTGDHVRVDSLTERIRERRDYVGGVRP